MSQTFGNKRGFMHITLHEVLIFARGLIRLWPKFVRDFGLRQGLQWGFWSAQNWVSSDRVLREIDAYWRIRGMVIGETAMKQERDE